MVLAALATTALPVAAEAHGRWDRGGWGGRGWHRDRGGVDGGDVLAGLLIIGGIAAIAKSAEVFTRLAAHRPMAMVTSK